MYGRDAGGCGSIFKSVAQTTEDDPKCARNRLYHTTVFSGAPPITFEASDSNMEDGVS